MTTTEARRLETLPDLLTVKELANYLCVSVHTVYDWNSRDLGPRPVKIGRHLRYPSADVLAWQQTLDRHDWEGEAR